MEVANPREGHEADRANMVNEHLPKVLPFDIPELRRCQRPVKRQRDHIIPPSRFSNAL